MEKKGPVYTYSLASDFIKEAEFEYFETYSFRRGQAYADFLENARKEYDQLLNVMKRTEVLAEGQEVRYHELFSLLRTTQYLFTANGAMQPHSVLTGTFGKDSPQAGLIKEILNLELVEQFKLLCAPEYRDAIVFYDGNGRVTSMINVCLSCCYMETMPFSHLNADVLVYDELKKFFLAIGHDVEEKDHFFLTQEMRAKREEVLQKRRTSDGK